MSYSSLHTQILTQNLHLLSSLAFPFLFPFVENPLQICRKEYIISDIDFFHIHCLSMTILWSASYGFIETTVHNSHLSTWQTNKSSCSPLGLFKPIAFGSCLNLLSTSLHPGCGHSRYDIRTRKYHLFVREAPAFLIKIYSLSWKLKKKVLPLMLKLKD